MALIKEAVFLSRTQNNMQWEPYSSFGWLEPSM